MRANTQTFGLTLALRDACGTIKISGGVARAGNAVVLSELCLIGAYGAADTAVNRGVVVMTRRALDCRGEEHRLFTAAHRNHTDLYCRLVAGFIKTGICCNFKTRRELGLFWG